MKRKGKKIGTATVMLFILFGLLGCSGKKTASEDEISGNPAVQITEDGEVNPETDSGAESGGAEPGFATPEEAVLDYLAGLRDNDYSRMEASFWGNGSAKDISCQYGYFCGIDLIPEIAENSTVIFSEKEDAAKLLAQITQRMNEADFGSMEFMGFVLPDDLSDTYSTDSYQGNLSAIAQNYGASELANRVAAIAVNGNQYLLFFDLIQQEDRWYNFQLGGFFASVLGLDSNTAGCVRMDEEEERYCLFMEAAKYNGRWYNSKLGNRLALQLGLYSEYMGTMPLEAIGDPADLEELITYI